MSFLKKTYGYYRLQKPNQNTNQIFHKLFISCSTIRLSVSLHLNCCIFCNTSFSAQLSFLNFACFSFPAAKLLHQTAKTCQCEEKNVNFSKIIKNYLVNSKKYTTFAAHSVKGSRWDSCTVPLLWFVSPMFLIFKVTGSQWTGKAEHQER